MHRTPSLTLVIYNRKFRLIFLFFVYIVPWIRLDVDSTFLVRSLSENHLALSYESMTLCVTLFERIMNLLKSHKLFATVLGIYSVRQNVGDPWLYITVSLMKDGWSRLYNGCKLYCSVEVSSLKKKKRNQGRISSVEIYSSRVNSGSSEKHVQVLQYTKYGWKTQPIFTGTLQMSACDSISSRL